MRVTIVLGLLLVGCVEETLVIGDDRARLACEDASTVAVPSVGCTTLVVESVSPYGCLEEGIFGSSGRDHAGSWVRLANASGATLRVRVIDNPVLCGSDAGATSCAATATVRGFGGTPCACSAGSTSTYDVGTTTSDFSIDAPNAEVLLEPLGATFEVSLCSGAPIGP